MDFSCINIGSNEFDHRINKWIKMIGKKNCLTNMYLHEISFQFVQRLNNFDWRNFSFYSFRMVHCPALFYSEDSLDYFCLLEMVKSNIDRNVFLNIKYLFIVWRKLQVETWCFFHLSSSSCSAKVKEYGKERKKFVIVHQCCFWFKYFLSNAYEKTDMTRTLSRRFFSSHPTTKYFNRGFERLLFFYHRFVRLKWENLSNRNFEVKMMIEICLMKKINENIFGKKEKKELLWT